MDHFKLTFERKAFPDYRAIAASVARQLNEVAPAGAGVEFVAVNDRHTAEVVLREKPVEMTEDGPEVAGFQPPADLLTRTRGMVVDQESGAGESGK